MVTLNDITRLARSHGLIVRGAFSVSGEDYVPDISKDIPGLTLILFGNAGSSIWECFSESREYADGAPDPLNRWSERIGEQIATRLSGRALFPFGGPPYQPFISWAKKAESLRSSKVGMLIHPQYGLWHAYRFAVAIPESLSIPSPTVVPPGTDPDICNNCVDQPCLNTCPVDAFTASGYEVEDCYGYLKQNPESSCRTTSCQARTACPQGSSFHYHQKHARFHMDAFFSSIANQFEN